MTLRGSAFFNFVPLVPLSPHPSLVPVDSSSQRLNPGLPRCRQILYHLRYSLVAQLVKSLPTVQETCFQFLGWEDPLEKGMASHSSILAWRIPQTEELGGLQSMGSQRVRHD